MFSVISKSLLSCLTTPTKILLKKNIIYEKTKILRREKMAGDDFICPNLTKGIDFIRDPTLNKGLAFTIEERQSLGILGLIAPCIRTLEEQLEFANLSIDRYKKDLNKYLFLADLMDRNERLFFCLLDQNIEKFLPIVYTPTVGLACQRFGIVYRRPRGLYITLYDKGHMKQILKNWPRSDVRAICFTDGERILGLGDLGAYGMGIPIGKLSLYTALAGIKPHQCLPVMLDVGTDNQELLEDPLYIGIRRKRARGKEYDDFIEEFMQACVWRYGSNTLLQFEDFALPNATPLLNRYRHRFCTFNDDIQGTAGVAVAGLLAAEKLTKKKISEQKILFLGAGSAATGIANLTVLAMKDDGLSEDEVRKRILMFDINGLLTKNRPEGLPGHAKEFAADLPNEKDFEKAVETIKPTCLIGCSAKTGAFSPAVLKSVASNCERPIIFALSNPTSRAECTAQQAYDGTEGRCVFASGSPFPPVEYGGKKYITGQGNNSYIFPGIALGILAVCAYSIPDKIFLESAKALRDLVTESDYAVGRIYPPLAEVKKVSIDIAVATAKAAYELQVATVYPPPKDLKSFIQKSLYSLKYPVQLPYFYPHPKESDIKVKSLKETYEKYFPNTVNVKEKPAQKSYMRLCKKCENFEEKSCDLTSENKNNNMEAFIKEVEKSRFYFDCWMFVVQFMFYYFIINPPN